MALKSFILASVAVLSLSTAALAENTGTIVQNGNGNAGGMSQVGRRNDGTIAQFGNGNVAGMTQVGRHNNGAIGQNGDGNLARLKQLGF